MFIHLEMRKTMSQEPFDFSSTAESDFAPSHAYVSKKTKKEERHIYRLHIHHRKRCRFYSSDLVWTGSASFSQCFIHENTDSYRHGSYVCHLLFHRHKILYGIKNAFKCS